MPRSSQDSRFDVWEPRYTPRDFRSEHGYSSRSDVYNPPRTPKDFRSEFGFSSRLNDSEPYDLSYEHAYSPTHGEHLRFTNIPPFSSITEATAQAMRKCAEDFAKERRRRPVISPGGSNTDPVKLVPLDKGNTWVFDVAKPRSRMLSRGHKAPCLNGGYWYRKPTPSKPKVVFVEYHSASGDPHGLTRGDGYYVEARFPPDRSHSKRGKHYESEQVPVTLSQLRRQPEVSIEGRLPSWLSDVNHLESHLNTAPVEHRYETNVLRQNVRVGHPAFNRDGPVRHGRSTRSRRMEEPTHNHNALVLHDRPTPPQSPRHAPSSRAPSSRAYSSPPPPYSFLDPGRY